MKTAHTERFTPVGLKCPWSSSPLRLSYLQSHLSLTCSRVTSTATVLENEQQTFALCVGRHLCGSRPWDSVFVNISKQIQIPTISCGVYLLIGCRLWWQADASGTDSSKFVTLSILCGKHHREFPWGVKYTFFLKYTFLLSFFLSKCFSAYRQNFTSLFTLNTNTCQISSQGPLNSCSRAVDRNAWSSSAGKVA